MHSRVSLCFFVLFFGHCLCLGGLAASTPAEHAAAGSYESQIAEAKRLAGERSWAKAQEAYAAALAEAPDAEAKRWCELGRVDAGWREAEDNAGAEALLARIAEFESLLERYQMPGYEKDAFWFAAMESWADFRKARDLGSFRVSRLLDEIDYQNQRKGRRGVGAPDPRVSRFLDLSTRPDADRLTICEALGEQRPTPEARQRYLEAVRVLVSDPDRQWERAILGRLVEEARTAVRVAESADDRAWFALVAQLLTAPEADANAAKAAQWHSLLATTQGTRWEALAAGAEFCWRAASGWTPDAPVGAPVDLVARVRECDALLARLWPELKTDRPLSAVDWADGEKASQIVRSGSVGWLPEVVLALGNWRSQWSEPKVDLSLPSQVKPGEVVAGYFGATAVDGVEFTLARLTPEEWLQYEIFRQTSGGLAKEPVGEVVRRWSEATGLAARLGFRSGAVELGAALPPGFYLVTAEGRAGARATRNSRRFLVTGVEVALLDSFSRPSELYGIDAVTRLPVQGAMIVGKLSKRYDGKDGSDVSGRTDSDGRAVLRIAEIEGAWRSDRIAGFVSDQPFTADWRGRYRTDAELEAVGDVILDHEVYRPGETVRWKLVLRKQQDGRFVIPPTGTKLNVSAKVGDTVVLQEREQELNAIGTIAGEIQLPETLSPGDGSLQFSLVDEPKRRISTTWSAAGFRVEFYRPPAIKAAVELAGASDSLRAGREAAFRVTASYLSGGPMTGAAVRGQITFHRSYFDEEEPGHAASSRRGEVALPKPRDCSATTDDAGAAVFRCAVPEGLPEGTTVALRGAVQPAGAAEVQFDQTFVVTKSGYQYAPRREGHNEAALLGSEVRFAARVIGADRRAVAFDGTAQIVECRWNEVWRLPSGRLVTGDEAAQLDSKARRDDGEYETAAEADRPECLKAGYEETVVAEMPVHGDAEGNVAVNYAPQRAGLYRLRLMRDGTELFTPATSRSMTIVCDERTAELALPRDRMTVAVVGPVVNGAPLRVLIVQPKKQKRGWLTVCGAGRAVVQPFELQGSVGIVTVEKPPRFDGRGKVEIDMNGTRYGGGAEEFDVAAAESALQIAITPSADESRPGGEAQLHLNVRGESDAITSAEISVGVVDEAAAALGRPADWRLKSAFAERDAMWSYLSLDDEGVTKTVEPQDERCGISEAERWPTLPSSEYSFSNGLAVWARLGPLDDNGWGAASLYESCKFKDFIDLAARPTLRLRTRFDATAFWAPQVVTDAKGGATVSFNYPDNLTQWRIEAYAVGADGNSFGTATAFTRTSLPFQARLNLPRFLVAGDSAAASATLVNRTTSVLTAEAELDVDGAVVAERAGGESKPPQHSERASQAAPLRSESVSVLPQGEAQVSWPVRAENVGTAEFMLKAWAGPESDGMKLSLPVLEDGILQEMTASGQLAQGEKRHEFSLTLPELLDAARTSARVHLTGSRAAALLDALPYLVDYPYGCVEQTLSRFLPAVVTKRTLGQLGFDAASVEARILGTEATADAARRAKTAGLGRLDEVVARSLARLAEAQRGDGGFGWWPGAPEGDLWMTAYAVWGLNLAREAGVDVPLKLHERASAALATVLGDGKIPSATAESAEARAWALAALAGARLDEAGAKQRTATWTQAYAGRDGLSAAGRACLALAAAKLGAAEERAVLLRNLENGLVREAATEYGAMVHWGATSGYWRACDGAVESTALTLLALLELDPQHPLIAPAVNWLVLNRRGAKWESTRATAFAVLALSRFVELRGEAAGETEIEVLVNGAAVGRVKLNRETLLAGAAVVELPAAKLCGGANQLVLRRVTGDGGVYAMALAESWATGASVQPAGHLAQVARGFMRQKATPTLAGTVRIEPLALADGGVAVAGEEVQAVVTVTVPTEVEYVMVEVPKPAGCEPLNPLSGWDARIRKLESSGQERDERAIYREERDEKTVFFLERLDSGTWEICFGMRAVTPGDFRALPVKIEALYVPEIRANSDARRVKIEARK
ncbi:MAG TPA: alpha-2-macroglobulin family protein [Opitutaceae bacterium]|nr:alpha-2-macroglobulin family protein [Opitutaceae bacterium]